jgi:hypothetical protein
MWFLLKTLVIKLKHLKGVCHNVLTFTSLLPINVAQNYCLYSKSLPSYAVAGLMDKGMGSHTIDHSSTCKAALAADTVSHPV